MVLKPSVIANARGFCGIMEWLCTLIVLILTKLDFNASEYNKQIHPTEVRGGAFGLEHFSKLILATK